MVCNPISLEMLTFNNAIVNDHGGFKQQEVDSAVPVTVRPWPARVGRAPWVRLVFISGGSRGRLTIIVDPLLNFSQPMLGNLKPIRVRGC